jgi:peptide/nickel transport system substrate-binding protein
VSTVTTRLRLAGLAAVGALLAATAACAPQAPPASQSSGATDATLTVATTTDVVNYNPLVGNSRSDYWVTNLMYPHLLGIDESGKKTPSLASA